MHSHLRLPRPTLSRQKPSARSYLWEIFKEWIKQQHYGGSIVRDLIPSTGWISNSSHELIEAVRQSFLRPRVGE